MVTEGYVASQSSHSRGSAVDLTIFRLDTGMLVPMGGDFDFMDVRSHHAASGYILIFASHDESAQMPRQLAAGHLAWKHKLRNLLP